MKNTLILLVCLSVQSMSSPIPLSESEREFKEEIAQLILDKELIIEREVPASRVARLGREVRLSRVSRPVREARTARAVRPQREVSFVSLSDVKSKPMALKTFNKKTKISLSLQQ